jgi:O-antigen/teichoic acid export membrane protein
MWNIYGANQICADSSLKHAYRPVPRSQPEDSLELAPEQSRRESLVPASKLRSAYKWTILGNAARYLVGVGISIVLARLLAPKDYGLVGMVTIFVEFFAVIYDWGLAKAVIAFPEDSPLENVSAYFLVGTVIGFVSALILFFSAPLVAEFYREPRLILMSRVMSLALIIGSVRSINGALLVKRLEFRELSVVDIYSSLAAGCFAIVGAFSGLGVWALILNLFLQQVFQMVGYAWYCQPRYFPLPKKEIVRSLAGTTATMTGSVLLSKFYDTADYLIVGRLLGPLSLGLYALAFRFAMLVNDRISAVVNRVAFASFAQLRNDPEGLIDQWFAVSKRVTLATFPLLIWLSMNAQDFVSVVLGPQWAPASTPLRFLCIVTAVKILTNIVYQMMQATGHAALSLKFDVITSIILPLSFWLGCTYGGLLGLGVSWCIAFPILRGAYLVGVKRLFPFKVLNYLRILIPAIAVSGAVSLAMLPVVLLMDPGWRRLSASSLVWTITMAACFLMNAELRKLVVSIVKDRSKNA